MLSIGAEVKEICHPAERMVIAENQRIEAKHKRVLLY
jgi:hypothetical protein